MDIKEPRATAATPEKERPVAALTIPPGATTGFWADADRHANTTSIKVNGGDFFIYLNAASGGPNRYLSCQTGPWGIHRRRQCRVSRSVSWNSQC